VAADKNLITRLQQILPDILRGTPVTLAYLYGSAATGLSLPTSDVDIALVLCTEDEPAIPLKERMRLEFDVENALEQAEIFNPDVRIIDDLPLPIQAEAVMRGKRLFSKDEVARVEFETYTWKMYLDFEPVARMMRHAFFEDIQQHGLVRER
jgi:predicted nucleotidyltransferase